MLNGDGGDVDSNSQQRDFRQREEQHTRLFLPESKNSLILCVWALANKKKVAENENEWARPSNEKENETNRQMKKKKKIEPKNPTYFRSK